jgi:MATE family multidrug resistance protein
MRELVRLAWPIAVSVVSYALMTLVDTLFVGQLGASSLAGVGLGGVAAFALMTFAFGLIRATKVHVSQAVGAGARDEAEPWLAAAILIACGFGLVAVCLGQLVSSWLPSMTASVEAGNQASTYLSVRILGAPMVLTYCALREYRYGLGDSRSPMVAVVIANLANIVLDWWFIFGLDWGVAGAAWASVISPVFSVGMLAIIQRRNGFGFRPLRRRHLAETWRVGLPTGLQFLLEMGSFSVLSVMIAAISDAEMAAHQIAIQVIHFTFLPALAVAEAAAVMVGQAVGANRRPLVLRVSRYALMVACGYAIVCTVALAIWAPWVTEWFTPDRDVQLVCHGLLLAAMIFQVFDAGQVVASAALRGAGDVKYPATVGVIAAWVFTPPLAWLLGYEMELGALGGWIGLCLEMIAMCILFWRRLLTGGWNAEADRLCRERGSARQSLAPAE